MGRPNGPGRSQNQDFAALRQFAAETVRLTRELSGDTITVKKIAPVK